MQHRRHAHSEPGYETAVIIPCFNEAATIAGVVADIRAQLPYARVIVCDNASTDQTAQNAAAAGAEVTHERRPGKGNALRRLLIDVEADCYLMLDGDGTYDTEAAANLLAAVLYEGADMAVGVRQPVSGAAFPAGHRFGNRLFELIAGRLLGEATGDVLSGYRALSRPFIKSLPANVTGFEIETEITAHAHDVGADVREVTTRYYHRPDGSSSKLRTLRDGLRILLTMMRAVRDTRPAHFYGPLALLGVAVAIVGAVVASALASATGMAIAVGGGLTGLVNDAIRRQRQDMKLMRYAETPRVMVSMTRIREAAE